MKVEFTANSVKPKSEGVDREGTGPWELEWDTWRFQRRGESPVVWWLSQADAEQMVGETHTALSFRLPRTTHKSVAGRHCWRLASLRALPYHLTGVRPLIPSIKTQRITSVFLREYWLIWWLSISYPKSWEICLYDTSRLSNVKQENRAGMKR